MTRGIYTRHGSRLHDCVLNIGYERPSSSKLGRVFATLILVPAPLRRSPIIQVTRTTIPGPHFAILDNSSDPHLPIPGSLFATLLLAQTPTPTFTTRPTPSRRRGQRGCSRSSLYSRITSSFPRSQVPNPIHTLGPKSTPQNYVFLLPTPPRVRESTYMHIKVWRSLGPTYITGQFPLPQLEVSANSPLNHADWTAGTELQPIYIFSSAHSQVHIPFTQNLCPHIPPEPVEYFSPQ
jgi:hypothetical protein